MTKTMVYAAGVGYGAVTWIAASLSLAFGVGVAVSLIILLAGAAVIDEESRHEQLMERLDQMSARLIEVEARVRGSDGDDGWN
jgi:hypothetical protein